MSESIMKLGSIPMNSPHKGLTASRTESRVLKGRLSRNARSAAQLQMKDSAIFPAGPAMGSIGETEAE
jgi:hypothetical protein